MTVGIDDMKEIKNGVAMREIRDDALNSVAGGQDYRYHSQKIYEIYSDQSLSLEERETRLLAYREAVACDPELCNDIKIELLDMIFGLTGGDR